MDSALANFLPQCTPIASESVVWGNGTIPLDLTSYLSKELPPMHLITSVRALVLRDDQVLVIRDPGSYHLLPGGQRETNETLLETLQREMQEETGWSLTNLRLLGFKHFRYLAGPLPNYSVYPDFLQVVYTGTPAAFHPHAREKNGYELEALFRPRSETLSLNLSLSDQAFLEAATQLNPDPQPEE